MQGVTDDETDNSLWCKVSWLGKDVGRRAPKLVLGMGWGTLPGGDDIPT